MMEDQFKKIGDNYTIFGSLGSGSYGKVYLVKDSNLQKFAAKVIRKNNSNTEIINSEIYILKKLNDHLNIVKFKEVVYFNKEVDIYVAIIMEYCQGGDLYERIKKSRQKNKNHFLKGDPFRIFREEKHKFEKNLFLNSYEHEDHLKKHQVLIEVVKGVHQMHSKNIVHNDLKPNNILIGEDGTMKICDFGRSYRVINNSFYQAFQRSIYDAPEKKPYIESNKQIDVYALGVIFIEVLNGGDAQFQSKTGKLLSEKPTLYIKLKDKIYKYLYGPLIDGMLKQKVKQRLTIEKVLQILRQIQETKVQKSYLSNNYEKYQDSYTGDRNGNKKEGEGTMVYSNGTVYSGNWKNDKFHGEGICQFENGDKYDGSWEDGLMSGHGMLTYKNGDTYSGRMMSGKAHGIGSYIWQNGNSYCGKFFDGRKHDREGLEVRKYGSQQVRYYIQYNMDKQIRRKQIQPKK